jgi:hypothetical protein
MESNIESALGRLLIYLALRLMLYMQATQPPRQMPLAQTQQLHTFWLLVDLRLIQHFERLQRQISRFLVTLVQSLGTTLGIAHLRLQVYRLLEVI